MAETVELIVGGKRFEFPVVPGAEGDRAIDFATLRAKTGLTTYDPGFVNTAACRSSVTFLDGEQGILRYRGYPIEQLAEQSTFLEVAYLLIFGELPKKPELAEFTSQITHHTMLHEDVKRFYAGFPKDAHPMAVYSAVLGALSTFYQDSLAPRDQAQVLSSIYRLIAKSATIAAYAFKHSIGQPFMYPNNQLGYAANFLYMMFATPCEGYEPDPLVAKALDLLLILHADHEQNCSTSTVRLTGSSMANLFACISAGVAALWGPLHGGANQEVIEMLETIEREEGSARRFLEQCKDKNSTHRLMGFGHRIYKNFDPRAKIIKKACYDVLGKMGVKSKKLEIAVELEEMALKDDYFISRKLYPNVDFYSGIIYEAIGIPPAMFTVLFAMGRLTGWIAQWVEQHKDPAFKIGRPRQVYVGSPKRDYVPITRR